MPPRRGTLEGMDAVRPPSTPASTRASCRVGERRRAAHDGPLPIGHGQTNSQPRTVANMLRLLEVRPGQRVLDVGTGSGWTTALLAHLVGPTGEVIGVELEPELVRFGAANLAARGQPWASIRQAEPGVLGRPTRRRTTGSSCPPSLDALPAELVDQLTDEGIMVIPVAGTMLRVTNPGGKATEHGRYRFVPLR